VFGKRVNKLLTNVQTAGNCLLKKILSQHRIRH